MIDLHTHTDQSDGTFSPGQLVQAAAAMSLEALAITDHDTLAGYDIASPIAEAAGVELICAIELSTRLDRHPGEPRSPSIHLLGYFPDQPPGLEFRDWLLRLQQSRRARNVSLVAKLQSLGVDIALEEAQALGRNLTGRPHFARVLVSKGYVRTTQEAFDVYLADDAQAAVEREEPTLLEGIQRLTTGGGLAVLAHPVRLGRPEFNRPENLAGELVAAGLQGIEAFHSEHSAADTERFLGIARRFSLFVTGGSDFHGDNKPGIQLATGKGGSLCLAYTLVEEMRAAAARPAIS